MDMPWLQTLGDIIQLGMALVALPLFLYLLWRGWGPTVKAGAGRAVRAVGGYLYDTFTVEVMSSEPADAGTNGPGDTRDQQPATEPLQPIAKPSNGVTSTVTVNPVDAGTSEARELIRFQAKAEALAALIRAGKISNQAEAIELVFECSRTSSKRPDTPYQRARRLIEQLVTPQPAQPVFYDDLRARIEAEVHAEAAELLDR